MAEGFLRRASNRLGTAQVSAQHHFLECVSKTQEYIELSAKAALLCTAGEYPTKHWFADEGKLLDRIPEKLRHLEYHRLFLISNFWSEFCTLAKYGNEELGRGPEKPFRSNEAVLAVKHAEECHYAASQPLNYTRNLW
jgi:HEPN domain-containing protein